QIQGSLGCAAILAVFLAAILPATRPQTINPMPATRNNSVKVNPRTICFASAPPDAIFRTVETPTAIPGLVNTKPKRISQPLWLLRDKLVVTVIRQCNPIPRTEICGQTVV